MRNEGVSASLEIILSSGQHGICCESVLHEGSGMKEAASGENASWL